MKKELQFLQESLEDNDIDLSIRMMKGMITRAQSTLGKAVRAKHPSVKFWTGYIRGLLNSLDMLNSVKEYYQELEGEEEASLYTPPTQLSKKNSDSNKIDSPWA